MATLAGRLVFILALMVHLRMSESVISLEKNGYKGIVVAIHKKVPEDPELIENIMSMLTSASAFLYTATRRLAYFEEISIVVPGTWSYNGSYEQIQGGNIYSQSHVRVVKSKSKSDDLSIAKDTPFTKHVGECGEEGEYIQLTDNFVKTKNGLFGDNGNIFVHEWAHFRYGVFDEYGDEKSSPYYYDENKRIRLISCPKGMRGWVRDKKEKNCELKANGLPNKNCRFFVDEKSVILRSSIMFLSGNKGIDQFCDETPELKHDGLVPNKQNLKCQGKSTWEVVSKHKDFQNGRNPTLSSLLSPSPRFRVLQTKKNPQPTIVLVLDVSTSMDGTRIGLQRAAASRFIQYQLRDGSSLGIVEFSKKSNIVANITTVNRTTRASLASHVPLSTSHSTCIGCGIKTALELLNYHSEPTEGALIVLITDGEENRRPKLDEIQQTIRDSRVVINAIAFGSKASDKLEGLIKLTGGRGFFYDDQKVGHQVLDSALMESAITHSDLELQPVEIINRGIKLENLEFKEGSVVIDKDVARNVEFVLTFTYPVPNAVEFRVTSPSEKVYDYTSSEYEFDLATLSIRIKILNADIGKWKYWIQNNKHHYQDASLSVTGEPLDIKNQPVRVRSWISDVEIKYPQKVKFYAEVKKGAKVVVNATVIAKVYRPDGPPEELKLKDNGAGADSSKNDGVYSCYFTLFSGSGRYSVETTVLNNRKAKLKLDSQGSKAQIIRQLPPGADYGPSEESFSPDGMIMGSEDEDDEDEDNEDYDEEENDDFENVNFERSASAGSFKVDGWIPDVDKIPPARVTDLKIDSFSKDNWTFALSWTSPGDDLDHGTAEQIELKFHWDPEILVSSFEKAVPITGDNVTSGDLNPMEGSTRHRIALYLPPSDSVNKDYDGGLRNTSSSSWPTDRLCFALRAKDEAGNLADLSNVAVANFPVLPLPNSSNFQSMGILVLWLSLFCNILQLFRYGLPLKY